MMTDFKVYVREVNCVLILLLLSCTSVQSQASWNRSIDHNNEGNFGVSVLEISDSVYVVGALSYDEALPYGVLIGLHQNGVKIWYKDIKYEGLAFHMSECFKVNNQIWSTGSLVEMPGSQFKPVIVVHDFSQKELWRRVYDFGPYYVNFKRGIRAISGNSVIVFFNGYLDDGGSNYIHKHGYLVLDSLGEEISRHWFQSEFDVNLPFDIIPFPGGGYMQSILEISSSTGIPFEHTLEIKRLDDTFGILWHKTLPCEERGSGKFTFDSNKNIYVTWTEDPIIPGDCSPWASPAVLSYDSLGNFRWKYVFDDNPRHRILGNLITTSEGNIAVCGLDEPGFDPLQWGWMVCIDTLGNLQWDRKYTIDDIPGEYGGRFGDIRVSSDNHLLVVGSIHDKYPLESAVARQNVWLVKAELNGCIEGHECEDYTLLTSIEKDILKPVELSIHPNPCVDELNIEVPTEDQYTIDIFDICGMSILKTTGIGKIFTIRVNNLSPGPYILQLSSQGKSVSQKIVIVK